MANHLVDQIAEQIKTLLTDATCAEDRVFRDRSPTHVFQGRTDLPAIDIRIGEDNPIDGQVQSVWRSDIQINVDLYVYGDSDEVVSAEALSLRKESYIALMVAMPKLSGGPAGVISIIPGGAEAIVRGESGSIPFAVCATVFFITYQHSLTDPSL